MQINYYTFKEEWDREFDTSFDSKQTLILVFGLADSSKVALPLKNLRDAFKNSIIIGSSTAGEIVMDELYDDSLVATVVKFDSTTIKPSIKNISQERDSFALGSSIANELKSEDLRNIFILSDGLNVNGSELTDGLNSVCSSDVMISGGLAGDGAKFESTWVVVDGQAKENYVSAIGFYGDTIRIGYGSHGGWDIFGIQRKVTRSEANVVYEVDNQPILDIYKKYLGEKAKELPASGLLFPLGLYDNEDNLVVRTILAVDEVKKSITFAGNIPQGSRVCLMKSNNDRLIDAAYNASRDIDLQDYQDEPLLTIAISCIGRKLVLKQRTEEELEAVIENLPKNSVQVGFYSYGEISPNALVGCDLHNQTMTLTSIWEKNA